MQLTNGKLVADTGLDDPVLVVASGGSGRQGGWRGKRALDVALSGLLILLTLPLFVGAGLAVKSSSRGPMLFRQRRVGRGGREFAILKFRTMRSDAQEQLVDNARLREMFLNGSHKIPGHLDPRVTNVGRILRRFSLDELPQLINVLRGDMSLVGPRPVERSQLRRDYCGFEHIYVDLRPGLTGLWQVSGRSTVQFPERAQMDAEYRQWCGPWLDAKIIARTPRVVFTGLGAG
ncbi:MAG: sugar transferase [Acidimicrobiales bacterium]